MLTDADAQTIKDFLLEDHRKYMQWLKTQSSADDEDEDMSEDESEDEEEDEEEEEDDEGGDEDGEENEEDDEEDEEEETHITYKRDRRLSSKEYRWVGAYALSGKKGKEELVRRGNTAPGEADGECKVAR